MSLITVTKGAFQRAVQMPVTLTISFGAILIAFVSSAGELFQFDRAGLAAGEIWRLVTCHVVHWNAEHIQWDLLMFLVLGAACEIRNPRRMWLCVAAAAASVSLLVMCAFPGIESYRGLSGIDTALFTLLAIDLMRDAQRRQSGMLAATTGGLLLGFMGKTAYEAVTGHAFFVDQRSAGFELLVWDHVAASVAGAAIAFGTFSRHIPQEQRQRRIDFGQQSTPITDGVS